MALILDADTEALVRTTNLIGAINNATYMFFVRKIANPSAGHFPRWFYWGDDPVTLYDNYVTIYYNSTGILTLEISVGGVVTSGTYTLPDNGLYHIVYVRNGTSHKLYVDSFVRISLTVDISGMPAPTNQYLGTDTFANNTNPSDYAYYREWNTVLTPAEILTEMNSADFAVVKTANLRVNTPFVSDILDISGNGINWSLWGTAVTYTTGVLNQSSLYARPLASIPVAYNQNARSGATTYDLWYRYTPLTTERVMGVFGFGDLVTYKPKIQVQVGTLGALTTYLSISGIENKPIQIPIPQRTPNFYYFRFETNAGNPSPAVLILSIIPAPKSIVPAGSIFINDDTNNFPGVFLSATDGEVLNFVYPFVNGEGGDTLSNGYMLFEDFQNSNLKTYSNQFVQDQTIAFGNGFVAVRANQTSNTFFVANNDNPTTAKQISSAGAVINTYSLTGNVGINAVAGNNNNTILYYARRAVSAVVKRWDLSLNVAMANFLPADGFNFISDILALVDGTLLFAYVSSPVDFVVKRYNESGTLLNTYTLGTGTFPAGTQPRIAYAHDNDVSFWAWSHDANGFSRFRRVQISDGSILVEFAVPEYEVGIYNGTITATPTARFGPSFSCPFLTLPPATTSPPGGIPETNPPQTILVGDGSDSGGLYEIVYNARKLNDTLWISQSPVSTVDVKKPDPTVQTGDLGE